ncbi:hypothetical protein VTN49DRAFT_7974 [Thermomyces lanuginosus]|uniref:uncharacterized protein n=1 Tax=Thermomyces lanuginosus TaxID=5541 RepID=UPI003742EC7C
MVRKLLKKELSKWIRKLPTLDKCWSAELQTLESHTGIISSVAISPNGQLLASGSSDKTIRLWDLPTGELRQTLIDSLHSVNYVSISPDGRLLVSRSYYFKETIKFWDLTKGRQCVTLEDHPERGWINENVFYLETNWSMAMNPA